MDTQRAASISHAPVRAGKTVKRGEAKREARSSRGPAVEARGAVDGPRGVGVGPRLARLANPVALGRSVLACFAKHTRALFCRSWVNRVLSRGTRHTIRLCVIPLSG